jgi:hypothetical protein
VEIRSGARDYLASFSPITSAAIAADVMLLGGLLSFLHVDALISGLVWVSIGVIYAVVLTKVTGKRLTDLGMNESTATEVEEALVTAQRTATELEDAVATEPGTAPRVLAGV